MTNAEIVEAINILAPDSEWVLVGDDFGDINWIRGTKPTAKQISDTIAKLPEYRQIEADKLQAQRDATLQKLASLGLTAEDLKVLGL